MRYLAAFAVIASSSGLVCQCTNPWPTVPGSAGVEGSVRDTLVYDPDGAGPIGERILVSGQFSVVGTVAAQNLAIYDPGSRTWSAFGPGPYPPNLELAGDPSSDLYVGGWFADIAGVAADSVAHFDGSNWSAVGGGVDGQVGNVEVLTNGDLVLTGGFLNAGTTAVNGIAKWDGTSWSSLAAATIGSAAFTEVVEMPNGDLCASVRVNASLGFRGVMRFDGSSWVTLGSSFSFPPADIAVSASGDLVACGQSVFGGSAVGRWNGTSWSPLPNAAFQYASELHVMPNGILVAAGSPGPGGASGVKTWDGFVWTDLGVSSSVITSFSALANGELVAAGAFSFIDDVPTAAIARWNGSSWSAASNGLSGYVSWLASRPDGSLFVGYSHGWQNSALVYQWNGSGWMPIGGGFLSSPFSNPSLKGLYALPDGQLISCGPSNSSGGASPVIQSWTGSTWNTVATATSGSVSVVTQLRDGDLIAAGSFTALDGVSMSNIGRFDGANWTPLGNGFNVVPKSICELPNGDLLVLVQSSVLRWNGSVWTQVGLTPVGIANALEIGTDGSAILAGSFAGSSVLRWDGSVWAPLGNGPAGAIQSLAVHPNGDLIASPLLDGLNPARPVERWDGTSWSPLGGDIDGTVFATEVSVTGDVLLGGHFVMANGEVRCRFARITTSCPAASLPLGGGCFQAPVLAPTVLPWLGSTTRNTANNLGTASLAVVVTGLSQLSLPLSSVLSAASPGCNVLVSPDVLQLAVPEADQVVAEFVIPNVPALLATNYLQQVVTVELDAAGAIVDSKNTNALLLQVGAF